VQDSEGKTSKGKRSEGKALIVRRDSKAVHSPKPIRGQVAPAARQLAGFYHERVPIAAQRAGGHGDYSGGSSADTPGEVNPE